MFKAHSDDDFLKSMKIAPGLEPVHEFKGNRIADLENYAGYRIARERGWHFNEFVLEHGWVVDIEVLHCLETHNTFCTFNGRPVYATWPSAGLVPPFVLTRGGWKRLDELSCPEILLCCAEVAMAPPKITEVPEPKYAPEVCKPPEPAYYLIAGLVLGLAWIVLTVMG